MKRKSQLLALLMALCLLASLAVMPVAADEAEKDNATKTDSTESGKCTHGNDPETCEECKKDAGKCIHGNDPETCEECKKDAGKCTHGNDPETCTTCHPELLKCEHGNPPATCEKCHPELAKCEHGNTPATCEKCHPELAKCEHGNTPATCEKCHPELAKCEHGNDPKTCPKCNPPATPTPKVNISISPSSIDFGSLTKGTTSGLTKSFTITNNSDYTTRIGVSGSLTNATYSLSSSDLSKGSSCTVTVMVTSTSSTGSIGGKLTVSAAINDAQAGSDSSSTSVSVSGKIVDEKYTLSLSPTSKDFGKLVEGYEEKTAKEKELTVTVTNKSDNTVRMGDVKGNDHFTVTATQSGTISLKYNEDVTYKIVPKQDLKAGSYTDKIVFQTREGATAEFKATLVVEKKEAALTLSPSTLEFGTAQQGYTPVNYQTVTIKNNTDYPMTLEQPSSYNYEIGLLSNKSLPAGGTATFTIRPMTGLMANSYNGKITVRANGYSADLSVNFTVTANLMLLTFLDVPNGYSLAADIAYVTQRGLMNGTGNGNFTPYGPTTRGQIVTILHRLAGQPVVVGTGFTDVAAGSYCENAVKWAAAIGITKGYEDGTFKPGDPITREQMATFLFRYASTRNLTTALRADLNKFPDGDSVSAYARDALAWANGAGLVNGTGEGTLNPSGGATRAQAAAILHRFCENVAR